MSRFDYVKYDKESTKYSQAFKEVFMELEERLEWAIANCTAEREKDYWKAALLHSEISFAMVGKAIRDSQIAINGSAEVQEEKSNE